MATSTAQSSPGVLPAANVRSSADPFPSDEFTTIVNIPVFAEHVAARKDGTSIKFGLGELQAICDRCNRRIEETGDFAAITLGHTPSPDNATGWEPEVVGFAGPYRIGRMPGTQKYAILADFHVFKGKENELRKRPRRSPELWMAETAEDMFLDPIALLGALPPRLDMGMLYAKVQEGREVWKYAAAGPSPSSVFVPDGTGEKVKYAEWEEEKHPRDEGGKFGEGSSETLPKRTADALPTEPSQKPMKSAYGEFMAAGGTEREWDDYRKQQNALSREKQLKEFADGWRSGTEFGGNAIVNYLRFFDVELTEKAKRILQDDDTFVSTTSLTGRGVSRTEAKAIHKEVSLVMGTLRNSGFRENLKSRFPEKATYAKQTGDPFMLDPDEIQQILDALEQLDWVQQAKSMAAGEAGNNATPEGGLPGAPAGAMPPELGAPPEAAAGPPPGLAGTPAPPVSKEPGELPGEEEPDKEKSAMAEPETCPTCGQEVQKANYQAEGDAQGAGLKKTAEGDVEEPGKPKEGTAQQGKYARQGQKVRHAMEQQQYGAVGHKLMDLEAQVEKLKGQVGTERCKRVEAERYAALNDRRQHFVMDVDKEVERCKYAKMTDDQFAAHIEVIDNNYRRIPIGEQLPLHGRGIDMAANLAERPGLERSDYSKAASDEALDKCLTMAARGEKVDYGQVLAQVKSQNHQPLKT